jgi:hypothetical protein
MTLAPGRVEEEVLAVTQVAVSGPLDGVSQGLNEVRGQLLDSVGLGHDGVLESLVHLFQVELNY